MNFWWPISNLILCPLYLAGFVLAIRPLLLFGVWLSFGENSAANLFLSGIPDSVLSLAQGWKFFSFFFLVAWINVLLHCRAGHSSSYYKCKLFFYCGNKYMKTELQLRRIPVKLLRKVLFLLIFFLSHLNSLHTCADPPWPWYLFFDKYFLKYIFVE